MSIILKRNEYYLKRNEYYSKTKWVFFLNSKRNEIFYRRQLWWMRDLYLVVGNQRNCMSTTKEWRCRCSCCCGRVVMSEQPHQHGSLQRQQGCLPSKTTTIITTHVQPLLAFIYYDKDHPIVPAWPRWDATKRPLWRPDYPLRFGMASIPSMSRLWHELKIPGKWCNSSSNNNYCHRPPLCPTCAKLIFLPGKVDTKTNCKQPIPRLGRRGNKAIPTSIKRVVGKSNNSGRHECKCPGFSRALWCIWQKYLA